MGIPLKKLYTIKEAAEFIPVSIPSLYQACTKRKIPSVKVGGRVLIPSWYLEKIINEPCAVDHEKE